MDQVQPTGRIDVISDVICPWCYIGKRQLERALDLLATQHCRVAVAWHPFQLNPEMPAEGVERTSYRIAKFGSLERSRQMDQRITETAATVGLEFHLDRIVPAPHTGHGHRLIRLAGQLGYGQRPDCFGRRLGLAGVGLLGAHRSGLASTGDQPGPRCSTMPRA